MSNMPRLAENERFPQPHGGELDPFFGSAAMTQLMAMLEDVCRVQKQHRVRLMLVERSLHKLRRRVSGAGRTAARHAAYGDEQPSASHRFDDQE
jgi:hypothetical protein